MTAPTTHLLDIAANGTRRFPDRPFPTALCGADDPGPIDLTPYGGGATCRDCIAWDAEHPQEQRP